MPLEEYRDSVAGVATLVTILQFLSGSDICFKITRQGSTGDISGFPFVGGTFSTCMWLTYGWLLHDTSMTITNGVGLLLQAVYLSIYLRYCLSPGSWYAVRRQMTLLFGVAAIVLYSVFLSGMNPESLKPNVGLVCCVASIIFCAAPLLSLQEVFRTQSSQSLPFPFILASFLVTGLWWCYGVIIQNPFVQYPNLIGCGLAGFQLMLFAVYPAKNKDNDLRLPF